jgi:2-iminobutanoate/2-iminopropanoate deaminase
MRKAITGTTPAGPYSPGIVAEGRFLFVSGQGPLVDGQVVAGTIEEETELTLYNVGIVLERAGATFADVVRCGVFLTDLDNFARMNAVYERVFPEPRPARTTVGTALIGMKVEIDCIALLPPEGQ